MRIIRKCIHDLKQELVCLVTWLNDAKFQGCKTKRKRISILDLDNKAKNKVCAISLKEAWNGVYTLKIIVIKKRHKPSYVIVDPL